MRLNFVALETDYSIPPGHWRLQLWLNCMWHWLSGAAVGKEKVIRTYPCYDPPVPECLDPFQSPGYSTALMYRNGIEAKS